jgi:hypothetical protein
VNRVRNLLIMYGAVAGSGYIVRVIVAAAFQPRPWTGLGTDSRAVAWYLASTCFAAALGGFVSGKVIDVQHPGKWALLLGILAALEDVGPISWESFSGIGAFARLVWAGWFSAAIVGAGSFLLVRARGTHARVPASAA